MAIVVIISVASARDRIGRDKRGRSGQNQRPAESGQCIKLSTKPGTLLHFEKDR